MSGGAPSGWAGRRCWLEPCSRLCFTRYLLISAWPDAATAARSFLALVLAAPDFLLTPWAGCLSAALACGSCVLPAVQVDGLCRCVRVAGACCSAVCAGLAFLLPAVALLLASGCMRFAVGRAAAAAVGASGCWLRLPCAMASVWCVPERCALAGAVVAVMTRGT